MSIWGRSSPLRAVVLRRAVATPAAPTQNAAAALTATSTLTVGQVVTDTNLQAVPEPNTGLGGSGSFNSSTNGWGSPQPTTSTYLPSGGPPVGNGTHKRFTAQVAFTPPNQGVLMLQQIVIGSTSGTMAVSPGDTVTIS